MTMVDAALLADEALRHGALQKPAELHALIALAAQARPQVVVEVGCGGGGTLYAWTRLAPTVIGVDLPGGPFSSGQPRADHGATVIDGDSHDPATLAALQELLAGRPADVLFLDGDHTEEGVTQDLADYLPLVRPGGLAALHDICHHPGKPQVGVDRCWAEARRRHAVCEIVHQPTTWGGIGVILT